jgi:hypothetical protein
MAYSDPTSERIDYKPAHVERRKGVIDTGKIEYRPRGGLIPPSDRRARSIPTPPAPVPEYYYPEPVDGLEARHRTRMQQALGAMGGTGAAIQNMARDVTKGSPWVEGVTRTDPFASRDKVFKRAFGTERLPGIDDEGTIPREKRSQGRPTRKKFDPFH